MKKEELLKLFADQIKTVSHTNYGETYVEIDRDDLHEVVTEMTAIGGATLMCITASDDRMVPGIESFRVFYAFRVPLGAPSGKPSGGTNGNGGANGSGDPARQSSSAREIVVVVIRVPESDPEFPSITGICVAANWYEREIFDMFGIFPEHHLDMRRLCHHKYFPVETFPLRKGFSKGTDIVPLSDITNPRKVHGVGIYELPVGPIHAGIIEPGHFRFSCFGEHVINLDAQLFYTHRGIEKKVEGMDHFGANFLAERVCGVCSLAHSVAYSQAVEKLCGAKVPERAETIRAILLELERMTGHLTDIMGIAVDVAYYAASTFASRMREDLLSAAYGAVHSRYFRSVNMPGGLRRDIPDEAIKKLAAAAGKCVKDLAALEDLLMSSTTFLERVETTGVLFAETASEIGVVGVGARASGIHCDARKAFGYGIYGSVEFDESVHHTRDVYARMCTRIAEMRESEKIISQGAASLKPGPVSAKIDRPAAFMPAIGVVEAPKGEHAHFVMFDDKFRIHRYNVRSASYANWLALTFAVKGNIVPDFPVINKSFNLCYSSCDR